MEIVQKKQQWIYGISKPKDTVVVTLYVNMGAYIKVYFGASVKRAKMYALGVDNSKPVLVPVESDGYKVNNCYPNQAGMLRFRLRDDALDIFGLTIAKAIREDIEWQVEHERRLRYHENTDDIGDSMPNGDWELTGRIDDEQRVWIEIDKDSNQ